MGNLEEGEVFIKYSNDKVKEQCTSVKEAGKLFGGNKKYILGLFSRINALENAENIKDIIYTPQFRFHKLNGTYEGYFSIDITNRRDKWRLIICLLDENEEYFHPCNIDEISDKVEIVEVKEVSPHYE